MSRQGYPQSVAEAASAKDTPMLNQDRSAGAQGQRALSKSRCRAAISRGRDHSDVWELSQDLKGSHGSPFLARPV